MDRTPIYLSLKDRGDGKPLSFRQRREGRRWRVYLDGVYQPRCLRADRKRGRIEVRDADGALRALRGRVRFVLREPGKIPPRLNRRRRWTRMDWRRNGVRFFYNGPFIDFGGGEVSTYRVREWRPTHQVTPRDVVLRTTNNVTITGRLPGPGDYIEPGVKLADDCVMDWSHLGGPVVQGDGKGGLVTLKPGEKW